MLVRPRFHKYVDEGSHTRLPDFVRAELHGFAVCGSCGQPAGAVTACSKRRGRMRILEGLTDPGAIAEILHGARAPPRSCPPGQLGLFVKLEHGLGP